MNLKQSALACILSLGVALTGWAPGHAAPKMELQIATGDPGANYFDNTKKATLLVFADYLERVSGGELKCKLAVGTLGGESEVFQQTMMGTNNIAITTEGPPSSVLQDWNVLNIPYLFENEFVAEYVLDGDFGKELAKELEDRCGVRILAFASNAGFRHIINARRPVTKMEDLKGLKIRTVESPAQIKFFELMGATATPVAWGEVYTSIESGVVDGLNNNANGIFLGGMERLAKYITRDSHVYAPAIIVTNGAWFDSLPANYQSWIMESANVAKWTSRVLVELAEAAGYEKLSSEFGTQISYFSNEEKARIKKEVLPKFKEWMKSYLEDPTWIDKIEKAVAEAEQARANINK